MSTSQGETSFGMESPDDAWLKGITGKDSVKGLSSSSIKKIIANSSYDGQTISSEARAEAA